MPMAGLSWVIQHRKQEIELGSREGDTDGQRKGNRNCMWFNGTIPALGVHQGISCLRGRFLHSRTEEERKLGLNCTHI